MTIINEGYLNFAIKCTCQTCPTFRNRFKEHIRAIQSNQNKVCKSDTEDYALIRQHGGNNGDTKNYKERLILGYTG